MVLRHTEHLHHVVARLGHHDAERGKQYREVGARPVYLQVLQRRSCFPIAPRGRQETSCKSSSRLTMWSPSGNCRSSTNIWATYARFALLKAAVLARLVMMIMMVLVMMRNVQLRDHSIPVAVSLDKPLPFSLLLHCSHTRPFLQTSQKSEIASPPRENAQDDTAGDTFMCAKP